MIICGIICCSIRLTPLLPVKKFCGVQLYLIYIYIYIYTYTIVVCRTYSTLCTTCVHAFNIT